MKHFFKGLAGIGWAILIITLISLILVLILLFNSNELISDFDDGVYRATYQFILIVVIGGAVSLLYREYTRIKETRENDRQKLMQMHTDLVNTYNSYKEIKRLLRATAWRRISKDGSTKEVLLISAYVPLLERLNTVQLTFESHKRALFGSSTLKDPSNAQRLKKYEEHIKNIEEYINEVVKEFETALREITAGDFVELSALSCTQEFLDRNQNASDARRKALRGFDEAKEILEELYSE